MQHFRAPTRLLDWTEAALIALHFALQASAATATRPAVWALNPFAVNVHADFEGALTIDRPEVRRYLPDLYTSRRELPPHPIAIDPPFVARRMLVQHSHFTVHGRDHISLESVPGLRHGRDLLKVVIDLDADDRDYRAWQLRLCGVSDTAIFPDLEGLARELGSEYGILPGPASTSAPSSTSPNATGQSAARRVTTRKP